MKYILMAMCLMLFACECDESCVARNNADDAIYCKPRLVNTSPEGVNLYRIHYRCSKVGGNDVYFSEKGTTYGVIVPNGKTSHTEMREVPSE